MQIVISTESQLKDQYYRFTLTIFIVVSDIAYVVLYTECWPVQLSRSAMNAACTTDSISSIEINALYAWLMYPTYYVSIIFPYIFFF